MGDLGQTLSGILSSKNSTGPNPMDILTGMGGFNGPIGTTPGIGDPQPSDRGIGVPEMGTPEDAVAEGVVSGWKPKKRSTLGFLADVLLGAFGGQPAFGLRKQRQNMQSAMEGFTHDPLESIRRMAQIPGQQANAWNLYNQHMDNARQDRIAERQEEVLRERARDRIAAMYGAVTPENAEKMLPVIQRYAQSRGIDDLPNGYDPDAIAAWQYGSVPVDDQIDNSRDAQYKSERLRQIDAQEAGRMDRHSDSQNRQDARTQYIQDRIEQRSKNSGRGSKNPNANKAYKDSNGTLIEFNKDGSAMKATAPGGTIVYYRMGLDGKPVEIKRVVKED